MDDFAQTNLNKSSKSAALGVGANQTINSSTTICYEIKTMNEG